MLYNSYYEVRHYHVVQFIIRGATYHVVQLKLQGATLLYGTTRTTRGD